MRVFFAVVLGLGGGCGRLGFDPPALGQGTDGGGDGSAGDATSGEAIRHVDSGARHACALKGDGSVWCWGDNENGQLGDGTTETRLQPQVVDGLPAIVELAVSEYSTLARGADGTVYGWGDNLHGTLGDGTSDDRLAPIRIDLPPAAHLVAGPHLACAVLEEGHLLCWGQNDDGEAGDPSLADVKVPRDVGLAGVQDVAIGHDTTCALLDGGAVWCWGSGLAGQLGDGALSERATPGQVALQEPALAIASGHAHTCVVVGAGQLSCWGESAGGRLGVAATAADRPAPVLVPDLPAVAQVDAGASYTCVRTVDGPVLCFGDNDDTQLGDGTVSGGSAPRMALAAAERISLGPTTSFAWVDGQPWVWGGDDHGEHARGVTRLRPLPAVLSGLSGVTALASGEDHVCAARADGVTCWGRGEEGQLGGAADQSVPTMVSAASPDALAAGSKHTCLLQTGGVSCFGDDTYGELDVGGLPSGIVEIGAGEHHNCARTSTGEVWCWGANGQGQLGRGTTSASGGPEVVVLMRPAIDLGVGRDHGCVVLDNNDVWCWGYNKGGEIGDGTFGNMRTTPARVNAFSAKAVAAGWYRTCAVLLDDTVSCWGEGHGTSPIRIVGLTGVLSLWHGGGHVCAELAGDLTECFGSNGRGQFGDGSTTSRDEPTTQSDFGVVSSLALGDEHTCALRGDGTVACAGWNLRGAIGDGARLGRLPEPLSF